MTQSAAADSEEDPALARRLVGEDMAKLIQLGMQYEPEPPLGPIDWEPAVIEAVRPIWRGSLADVLAEHPHLDRRSPA